MVISLILKNCLLILFDCSGWWMQWIITWVLQLEIFIIQNCTLSYGPQLTTKSTWLNVTFTGTLSFSFLVIVYNCYHSFKLNWINLTAIIRIWLPTPLAKMAVSGHSTISSTTESWKGSFSLLVEPSGKSIHKHFRNWNYIYHWTFSFIISIDKSNCEQLTWNDSFWNSIGC